MKDFINKNKRKILRIALILLLLIVVIATYFVFFRQDEKVDENPVNDNNEESVNNNVSPKPEYTLTTSKDALTITSQAAKAWASDVQLYDCSGLPISSIEYPDITYYYLGANGGEYSNWYCTYYSKSLAQTRIFMITNGELNDGTEAMDIGEFGPLTYDSIDYIEDLNEVVDSKVIYSTAKSKGLDDEKNYVNMYLFNSNTYGYIWKLEERSKDEKGEYDIGVLVNTYVFDITGNLKDILQESVY
jgi:hypothetical protein